MWFIHTKKHFTEKINEAKSYANIKGVSGIHLDYLRYPGTAYKTTGGTAAISAFTKQITEAIHNIYSNIIVESFGFSTYKVMQIEIILHAPFQFQCLLFLFLV